MGEVDEPTIAESNVLTKYRTTGELVNRVLKAIADLCVAGASVRDLCIRGDKLIEEEVSKIFKKEKDITKGVAFPTCISVNNCINHFSPLLSDSDVTIADGDLVKIDLGAHVDGFIAVVAHSVVVGASPEHKVTGRKADAMLAAHYSAEAALRLFKPGNENTAISAAVTKVSECFDCNPVEGMLSFQSQQNRLDGEKMIQQNPINSQRKDVERCTIEPYEVYAMDVVISTGKGQGKEMDSRVTIFKKTDEVYSLKLKCSREFFRKVQKEHAVMPFNLRNFDDAVKARMGVTECLSHKLVEAYPVLWEKHGEVVAEFKYTVLVMPNGPQRITGLPFDLTMYDCDHKIEDNKEALNLVQSSLNVRKKNKKKAAAAAEASDAAV